MEQTIQVKKKSNQPHSEAAGHLPQNHNKLTITDVADALGLSKTTVSRAISGKGRIGAATRQRVLEFIEETDYRPSVVARGLAQSKTYNIAWVMPGDSTVEELPFFQQCMMGISQTAFDDEYDILIVMVFENDISQLERVIQNKKVDGIILGRTLVEDKPLELLGKSDIPYVVIGSTDNDQVVQIDHDHVSACRRLTGILLKKGMGRIALLGGSWDYMVNRRRMQGFREAFQEQGIIPEEGLLYLDLNTKAGIEEKVEAVLGQKADCIVCMDDWICSVALDKLQRDGIRVPEDIGLASFYDSIALAGSRPSITSLQFNPWELGAMAYRRLLDCIDGREVEKKTYLQYEVLLKNSTK